jgi:AraC-like DNA-binding protein
MSPNYLSDLLKKETGRNAQEHIHFYLIDKAKTQLLNSGESISQIAYGLGFEYPQHFSKIFKAKTGMSPAEYRNLS